jgi:hypothetical protein
VNPGLQREDFFTSFPFSDPATRQRIAEGLARAGI